MNINIYNNHFQLGEAAGNAAALLIQNAIDKNDTANIILATGTSQFETLNTLVSTPGIDWSKVVMFHLDEYPATILQQHKACTLYLDKFSSALLSKNSIA